MAAFKSCHPRSIGRLTPNSHQSRRHSVPNARLGKFETFRAGFHRALGKAYRIAMVTVDNLGEIRKKTGGEQADTTHGYSHSNRSLPVTLLISSTGPAGNSRYKEGVRGCL